MARTTHILIFDGMADWEPALLLASLRRYASYRTIAVGLSSLPILSMGGLRLLPESTMDATTFGEDDLLVVAGGDLWTRGEQPAVSEFLRRAAASEAVVAGICAGVAPMAWAGLLRDHRFTANSREEIRSLVDARVDHGSYVDTPAHTDRKIVTARGNAPAAFAEAAIEALGVFDATQIAAWRRVFHPL